MKIETVAIGVNVRSDQHPKTVVIHKIGGYHSGSDIGGELDVFADTWDRHRAGPTSFFTKLCGIREKSEILHNGLVKGERLDPLARFGSSLLCYLVSKYLGHFPKGLVEFHILVDALDCSCLRHPGTVRAESGRVALTTANDVLLDLCGVDRYVERTVN
jgi:hypothetical protein